MLVLSNYFTDSLVVAAGNDEKVLDTFSDTTVAQTKRQVNCTNKTALLNVPAVTDPLWCKCTNIRTEGM